MKNGLKKSNRKDLKTIAETIEEAGVCMITTVDHNGGLSSRPMIVQELDEDGSLWFFVLTNSNLMNEIRRIPVVNITFTAGKKFLFQLLPLVTKLLIKKKCSNCGIRPLKNYFTAVQMQMK